MRSVIVDLAAGRGALQSDGNRGGNCVLSRADQIVKCNGVTIAGETNLAAQVASDASALYARNVLDFLKLVLKPEGLVLDEADDIVAACLVARQGAPAADGGSPVYRPRYIAQYLLLPIIVGGSGQRSSARRISRSAHETAYSGLRLVFSAVSA